MMEIGSFRRFNELLCKKDRTCPECAEVICLAHWHRHKVEDVEGVKEEINKSYKVVCEAFEELIKEDYDKNGKYIPHHPYHISYYSTAEGTLNNKLKS